MTIELFFLLLSIIFLFYIGKSILKDRQKKREAHNLLTKLDQFNTSRNFPVSLEAYRDTIYKTENDLLFLLVCGKSFEGNHRDGDELIESQLTNNVYKRIDDHLKLYKTENLTLSLGYEFKKRNNLITFLEKVCEKIPNNSYRIFPLNKTWLIIQKKDDDLIVNLDKSILKLP